MGNVHMEATQINYRGGSKKMGVEEAIKAAGDEIDSLKSGLTNVENELNGDATVYPYADVITIEDAVPSNLADCSVKVEPVQDLHGYDHPWVGGAGKNKFNLDLTTQTVSGVTITVNDDGTFSTNGTASADININILGYADTDAGNTYKLNGCPSGGGDNTYKLVACDAGGGAWYSDTGDGVSDISSDRVKKVKLFIASGTDMSGKIFKPMVYLNSETDATFAPYTNICPISGHTEASVEVTDGDETTKTYTIALGDTIYGGTVDFDSGVMTVDRQLLVIDENTQNMSLHNTSDSTAVFKIITGHECVNDARQKSNMFTLDTNGWNSDIAKPCFVMGQEGNLYIQVPLTLASTVSDFITWLASNNVQIFYPLKDADITTIQLTPKQIQLLKGQNTLTASTGQISVTANGVSGSIGAVQERVNELEKHLPDAPTTDGAYVLTVTVADGTPTYSWESTT